MPCAPTSRAWSALVAPASVCAVVKADGYGHGAVPVGRAAIEAGAACLAVALVEEGEQLRDAGIEAPILVLSEPVPEAAESVVAQRLTPVVYTAGGIDALAKAASGNAAGMPLPVHLKVDSGMHRVGCAPDAAIEFARHVLERPELALAGVCTHFAVADEPGNDFTRRARGSLRERARRVPRRRHRAGHRPRVQHRGCDHGARGPFRHGAHRHRRVRHTARARARRPGRAHAGAFGKGAGVVRAAVGRGGGNLLRSALCDAGADSHRDRADRLRRWCATRVVAAAAAKCSCGGGGIRWRGQ